MLSVCEMYFPLHWLLHTFILFYLFLFSANAKWGPQFASKILIQLFVRVRINKGRTKEKAICRHFLDLVDFGLAELMPSHFVSYMALCVIIMQGVHTFAC